jgi:hypothetical protein
MRKPLIYIITMITAGVVGAGLRRLLPAEVLGFSKEAIYGPVVGFIVLLGLYPIVSLGKPFKKHLLRAMMGLGIGFLIAIGLDKLL